MPFVPQLRKGHLRVGVHIVDEAEGVVELLRGAAADLGQRAPRVTGDALHRRTPFGFPHLRLPRMRHLICGAGVTCCHAPEGSHSVCDTSRDPDPVTNPKP